ncbi:MAG TPA: GNAT family N-acetyltransferase [Candidatus Baltobacteraceae bacterium]|nr:GNAT family N-acetyltransferase [Candidatus Baltobacteraceae bacterium]
MSYIETERLILRTWMPGDAPALYAIAQKPEVARYLITQKPTMEQVQAWIARETGLQERDGFSCWPVVRKSDGALIGRCGPRKMPEGYVEIAWVFDSAVWRQGYAQEAASAVIEYCLRSRQLSAVYALINPDNAASIALAYRLGMRFDRVVRAYKRDLLRYERHA